MEDLNWKELEWENSGTSYRYDDTDLEYWEKFGINDY